MSKRNPAHESAGQDRLAHLLAAAAAPTEPGPLPGEDEALAAFRACHVNSRRFSMRPSRLTVKAAFAAGAGVLLSGSLAAAAAGALPGAAQETASTWLDKVGVSVPGPDDSSAGHADERGASTDAPAAEGADATANDKGEEVSEVARETDSTGVDKGAAVSEVASEGAGKAGEQGGAPEDASVKAGVAADAPAADADDVAPVETPNPGGTGTAGDATSDYADGAAESGTTTADEESGGRSAAGSGNQP